jgi:mannose-6-phosphate isomerase-like protein (cupin superfamily)
MVGAGWIVTSGLHLGQETVKLSPRHVNGPSAGRAGPGEHPDAYAALQQSSATGGALSSQRITLLRGAAGAAPHHHTGSSELFYVVSGAAEMLTGQRVLTAREGDLIVVSPGTVHAFAAAPALGLWLRAKSAVQPTR